ncbi:hypothetical protein [Pseudomonas sp. DCA-1]|uniref:hypothetical protein n=1 Tax=Pseudomonas sp. DCA-1 TaxID=3344874 RepID=UPI0039779D27
MSINKNKFCALSVEQIEALQISADMKGLLRSPFHLNEQNGGILVPKEAFKDMIDYITELALKTHAGPKQPAVTLDPTAVEMLVSYRRAQAAFEEIGHGTDHGADLFIAAESAAEKLGKYIAVLAGDVAQPPDLQAEELFSTLKAAMTQAVAETSFAIVTSAAEEAAMSGGRKDPSVTALGFSYEYTDATGGIVTLVVKSWDTSRTFQMLPDRNKMTIELVRGGKTLQSYTDSYDD